MAALVERLFYLMALQDSLDSGGWRSGSSYKKLLCNHSGVVISGLMSLDSILPNGKNPGF